MHRHLRLALGALLAASCAHTRLQAPLEIDHVWIMVTPNAPERAALEAAGFRISPVVNRHDGQGTASVTADFESGFLELMWPDPGVSIAPGSEKAAEKFHNRMEWRTSGWCPIGVGFRRTGTSTEPLPLSTWKVQPTWLPPGAAIEILTPRDDSHSPSLFISPRQLSASDAPKAAAQRMRDAGISSFAQPIGIKRMTAVRFLRPPGYQPIEALTYLESHGVLQASEPGQAWTVEVTFDNGGQRKTRDFRPDLPLMIRY